MEGQTLNINPNNNRTGWIIVIAGVLIIAAIIFLNKCSGVSYIKKIFNKEQSQKQCDDLATDTVRRLVYQDRFNTIVDVQHGPGKIVHDTIPALVDSLAIIEAFFSRYSAIDTLRDTNLLAILYYTVHQNRMFTDSFYYKILRPDIETVISHTVAAKPKVGFYVGANAGISLGAKPLVFGPEFLLITKKQKGIGFGYDIFNKTITGKFLIKL